jgi:hypothetical protein
VGLNDALPPVAAAAALAPELLAELIDARLEVDGDSGTLYMN